MTLNRQRHGLVREKKMCYSHWTNNVDNTSSLYFKAHFIVGFIIIMQTVLFFL